MVNKYNLEITDDKHPLLVKEDSFLYDGANMTSPERIVDMINELFRLKYQAEEYLYLCTFDNKMNVTGVFEVSHGTVNSSLASPREVAIRALVAGASGVIFLHNHPSQDVIPSDADKKVFVQLVRGLKLLGIDTHDFIVVGSGYYSFKDKLLYEELLYEELLE